MSEAEAREIADIRATICHWRVRGVTAIDAWHALGHARGSHAGWEQVRAYMIRWTLEHRPNACAAATDAEPTRPSLG